MNSDSNNGHDGHDGHDNAMPQRRDSVPPDPSLGRGDDEDDLGLAADTDFVRYFLSLPEAPPEADCDPDVTFEILMEEAETIPGADRVAARARTLDPGPETAMMLDAIVRRRLSATGLLDAACAAERLASWTQAVQHRYLAAFARPGVCAAAESLNEYAAAPGQPLHQKPTSSVDRTVDSARQSGEEDDLECSGSQIHGDSARNGALDLVAAKVAAAEVSAALRVSPISADRRISQAIDFADELPATLSALQRGVIDRGRSLVIADRTQNLPRDLRLRVEAIVVPKAASRNAGQLRGIVDRAVIAADPAAAKKRQEAARLKRSISLRAGEDSMSVFRAELPADKACTAFTVIDQIALIGSRRANESRTINALRADAFADIFDQLADHGSVNLHTILGKGHSNCDPRHPCPNHPGFSTGDSPDRSEPERKRAAEGAVVSGRPGSDIGSPDCGLGDIVDGAAVVFDEAINQPTTNGVTDRADLRTTSSASPDATKSQEAALPGTAGDEGRTGLETETHLSSEKVGLGDAEMSRPMERMVSPVLGTGAAQHVPDSAAFNCGCGDPPASSAIPPIWGLGTHQGRATGLNVTIAATTLAGLDDLPGELDGHGTIPADLARALAASAATVTAVAVNPSCGTALDLGRTVYRPRQAQRDYVNQRDQTCRFPSCRQPAWRCQLDHSDEFCPGRQDSGVTCPCNLACLCKFHHDLKTFSLWDTDHHADNRITFTSPTGRSYTTHTREWLTGWADDQTVETTESTTTSTPVDRVSESGHSESDSDDPPF